ncbi:hypothetical protein [Massilia sp. Se16.2.3]|uniref:hypothetical protein n=1 Tax=Massilia sp. Se16.2.3 TaxID=2709303 RepID=UPI0016015AE7|nr:hypothetical protein [Massilia sp. Se16.2.3]QNA99689.1 hypothetical protein G4G31_13990 [Massilia sp. Se16.2.3]
MNTTLRTLIVWLVLLALPFPGFASAAMLGCAAGHGARTVAAAAPHGDAHAEHMQAMATGMDHAAMAAMHDDAAGTHHGAGKCSACAACSIGAAIVPAPPCRRSRCTRRRPGRCPSPTATCLRSTWPCPNDLPASPSPDSPAVRSARGCAVSARAAVPIVSHEDVMTFARTLFRVAAPCLLAAAAHAAPAQPSIPAAAADAQVPAVRYVDAARYRAPAAAAASPDRGWREQNRIVGATNSMMLTMGGAGHGDAHAGHGAAAPAPASAPGHAGHGSAAAPDPHAGHAAGPSRIPIPHTGLPPLFRSRQPSRTPAIARTPCMEAARRMAAAPAAGDGRAGRTKRHSRSACGPSHGRRARSCFLRWLLQEGRAS